MWYLFRFCLLFMVVFMSDRRQEGQRRCGNSRFNSIGRGRKGGWKIKRKVSRGRRVKDLTRLTPKCDARITLERLESIRLSVIVPFIYFTFLSTYIYYQSLNIICRLVKCHWGCPILFIIWLWYFVLLLKNKLSDI